MTAAGMKKMKDTDLQPPADPVREAAESVEDALESHLLSAWYGLVNGVEWVQFEQELEPARREIIKAFLRGRNAIYDGLGPFDADEPIRKDTQIEFRFDRVAPTTLQAAADFAAQWVREITEETRALINQTIQQKLSEGAAVPDTAAAVKEGIGLTAAQAGAVANYRRMLEERNPGALNRDLRDRRFDASLQQHLAGLKPLSEEQIARQVGAYHERYLRHRAKTIARFESLFASNSGALAGIRHAAAAGRLPATVRKVWLVARDERLCPRCRSIPEIQPDGVGLDDVFEWRVSGRRKDRSGTIDVAPLHPLCRCTVTYRVMR